MKFRPDIEGLRALAIAPVVVFHAWPSLLPGGFVGVDVFFVISGYLITTLLLQRLEAGRYSIASFYAARIRRIFPALFVMLAAVIPACLLLLEPEALREFARTLGATSVFASNIEFYRSTGYFEGAAELKPLLHTWSLAVEEQYYIAFPPLLALLWRFGRQRLGWVLAGVGLLSLAYCLWLMPTDAELAFYAAPARTFELMIGSFLAWRASLPATTPPRPRLEALIGWAALTALVGALFLVRANQAFPGPLALWPCLATALLIWVGGRSTSGASRWLSTRPLRWLGAHSFSLYLWHWPVLVLTRHALLDWATPGQALSAVLLSMLLAWASLRWVEAPVRRSLVKQRLMLWAGVATIIVSVAVALGLSALAKKRAAAPGPAADWRAAASNFSPDRARCHATGSQAVDFPARCRFGAVDATQELAVWGDSHGVELARALGDLMAERQQTWRVSELTSSGCPPALGFDAPRRPICRSSNEQVLAQLVADPAVRVVLLTARYELYLEGPQRAAFAAGLAASVQALRHAGKQVLLLEPVPTYAFPVPAALAQSTLRGRSLADLGQSLEDYRTRQVGALALVQNLQRQSGSTTLAVTERLCNRQCLVIDEQGRVLYFDDNHLSMAGAARVAPAVLPLLER
jgi:peptidoglycan/LPS O-acetylase OafA/YrhL